MPRHADVTFEVVAISTRCGKQDVVSPWTRSNSFVGLGPLQDRQLGATVVERDGILTGVAIFSTQGSFGPEDFCSDFEAKKARWAATLDGTRIAFEVGRSAYSRDDAVTPAREKPLRREMYGLFRSPCGRFTLASWWQNGSNAPEGASFEYD